MLGRMLFFFLLLFKQRIQVDVTQTQWVSELRFMKLFFGEFLWYEFLGEFLFRGKRRVI